MRAYAVERFGDAPASLDLPRLIAADGYVVRVAYAGVNPLDSKLVENLTPQSSYPFVLGVDFAGVLEHVPSTERDLREGDRVFGIARPTVCPGHKLLRTPAHSIGKDTEVDAKPIQ